ncbi:hypothetical protein D3C81_1084690 [compost metagenome]
MHFLHALFRHQQGNAAILAAGRGVLVGNEDATQRGAVVRQTFRVGHPGAVLHRLEAPRRQGVELGHGFLLVQQQLHLRDALRRQRQAQPGHHGGDDSRRDQRVGEQPLLAHAGGREHGHLAFQVQPSIGQQDAEEQPERQDQLQEARQPHPHDHEQHAGLQHALRGLRQVLDETAAHDDHQQHGADRAQGHQHFAGEITEDNQTGHSRVVTLGRLRSN